MNRVRIGIVGCGAIAQVQHMPNLHQLQELFEVTWTCDVSCRLAEYVAGHFSVPNHATDYRAVLAAADVDAVLLCHRDPKTEIAIASLQAGKHILIEKPICFSNEEAAAIDEASAEAGTVSQVGYMKVYDPAFEVVRRESQGWEPSFVQINHLHPRNELSLNQFHIQRFDDIPPSVATQSGEATKVALRQALGEEVPPETSTAFFALAGSMIHDLYGLRTIMGNPTRVVGTEVWRDGRAFSTVLEYATGARCVATWIDLPDLWDFVETLEIYGDDRRIILRYPTGFSRGQLSQVTIQEIDATGVSNLRQPVVDWESPFVAELRHFHDCILNGAECRTPVSSARDDICLIINIIQSFMRRAAVAYGTGLPA